VLWQATPTVALRPDFSISGTSSDASAPSSTSSSGWGTSIGVGVLFTLHEADHLRTYIVPSLSYSHNSSSNDGFGASSDVSGHTWGGSGAFGAQYGVSPHFAVFGELGVGVQRSSTTSEPTGTTVTSRHWGTQAGVGVVFYP
jgi:hypothetical protein